MDDKNKPNQFDSENSLDAPETVVQPSVITDDPTPKKDSESKPDVAPLPAKKSLGTRLRTITGKLNIYLLGFVLVLVVAAAVIVVSVLKSRQESANPELNTQGLDQATLDRLKNSTSKVGDPKQILSIESNAVFAGTVLVRDSLEVAGQIKVGGSLSLPGITVSGTSSFDQVELNSLSIAGDANLQGQLTVAKNLTVNGGGSFSGNLSAPSLSVDTLQLNKDIQLNRHIDAGGGTPNRSNGTALGSGGTVTVSGTDTAGTVTINTGGSSPAGCFVTITFAATFNGTPHIVISPVGSKAAALEYYVNRTSTNFSICTLSNPPDNTAAIIFDYVVID